MPVRKRNQSPNQKAQKNVQREEKKEPKTKKKNNGPVSLQQKFQNWVYSLFDEVDNITLIIFRIMWGIIMSYECWTFIRNDYSKLNGYYVYPEFAPKYYGFFWVNAWPGDGMYYHIWTMFVAGIGVTIGFMYHLNATIFFLGFTYLILLDACLYLNHFYLIAVMAFMLIILPAHRRYSVDAFLFPSFRKDTMPRHVVYLLRFAQIIVYFYAGVAKVNEDWLRGEPIRHWITGKIVSGYDASIFHYYSAWILASEFGVYFIAIGGLIFDLTAGFLLCFPRGIVFYFALINCVFFHVMNKLLMNIGIFPWVMLASTTLFFEPDWVFNIPYVSSIITPQKEKKFKGKLDFRKKLVLVILILFAVHQIVTPLRHHFYYDDVAWNEMGHRYSWRMKLRDKICDVNMTLVDKVNGVQGPLQYGSGLYGKQPRKVKPRPELMIQYAQYLARLYEKQSGEYPEIYLDMKCSLNYRNKQPMFREDVNIANIDPYDWAKFPDIIYPLQPLTEKENEDSILNWRKVVSLLTDPLQPAKLPGLEYHPLFLHRLQNSKQPANNKQYK